MPSRLRWEIHRSIDFYHARRRILSSSMRLTEAEKQLVKSVSARIHPKDDMYRLWDAKHYLTAGLTATRLIDGAIEKLGGGLHVGSVLDMPSGYGRVLRFLARKFPVSALTACDIDEPAVRFCAREFRAVPAVSMEDFSRVSVGGPFDLIWCGSLVTHLDEPSAAALLEFFRRHLSETGVCVFTTHGRASIDLIRSRANTYGLPDEGLEQVVNGFLEKGYGYADYPDGRGYGISVVSPERIRALGATVIHWREIHYEEKGWDNHHDVYAYALPPPLSQA